MPLQSTNHPRIRRDGSVLFTPSLDPGSAAYGERLVSEGSQEFRAWSPHRSKLAAFLLRDAHPLTLAEQAAVLYLGAGAGTTVSHLSDLVPEGAVFAVEIAPRPFEQLLRLAERRPNLVPIMADAREPELYQSLVGGVDLLYQDVAQRDQTDILLRNLPLLRDAGKAILMLKARSIDVTQEPQTLFNRARKELEGAGVSVDRIVPLSPYQKDHAAFLVRPGQTR